MPGNERITNALQAAIQRDRLQRNQAEEEEKRRRKIEFEKRINDLQNDKKIIIAATNYADIYLKSALDLHLIRNFPLHDVVQNYRVQQIQYPNNDIVEIINKGEATLRWGIKFGFTEQEEKFIADYRKKIFKPRHAPEQILRFDYFFVSVFISSSTLVVSNGSSNPLLVLNTPDFLKEPDLIIPGIANGLQYPGKKTLLYNKNNGYR